MQKALLNFLNDVFKIRPEEARLTGLAFSYLFFAIGAFIVARIARTVLFLEIPNYKEQLPLVYLGIALAVSTAMFGYTRVERKLRRDQTNMITLVFLIIVTLGIRGALTIENHAVYWVFYIWVEIFGAFLIIQFWSIINEIFHSRQAKRLFAIIGGGGVLSNVAFGFSTSALVKIIGTENLLFVIVGCLVVTTWVVYLLGKEARPELEAAHQRKAKVQKRVAPDAKETKEVKEKIFATRHVQFIAMVVMLTYVVSTMVDYQFQVIVGDFIQSKDARSAFFGSFFGVTGIIGGFIQFFVTSRLLERFGILVALIMLPLAMFMGSIGLLAMPLALGLWTISFTKGSENVLRYTVNDSTLQLLYLPLPSHLRGRAKATIDGILKPVSIGAAGLIMALMVGKLESLTGIPFGIKVGPYALSYVVAVALAGWIVVLLGLRKEYLKSLVQTLQKRRLNFADATFPISDAGTVNLLQKALHSEKLGEILHALELLPSVSDKLRAPLEDDAVKLLEHEAKEVRVSALDYLRATGSSLHGEEVARLIQDKSSMVRASATLAYCAIKREDSLAEAHLLLEDESVRVQAAAVAGLIRYAGFDGVLAAAATLKRMLDSEDPKERERSAWVLGEVGVKNFYQPLLPLLADDNQKVRHAAVVAAGKLKSDDLIDRLFNLLGDAPLGSATVNALAGYGRDIIPKVEKVLDDSENGRAIRVQAPKILARLDATQGATILCRHLDEDDPKVRGAVVSSLANIVAHSPGVPLDDKGISAALRSEAREAFSMLVLNYDLDFGEDNAENTTAKLLRDAIQNRARQADARIFSLLALKHPPQTIDLVSRNLKSSLPATRGNAVEVLDNLLEKDEKAFIIPLFDDIPIKARLEAAEEIFELKSESRTIRLVTFLTGNDTWLQSAAAVAAAEWGIKELKDEVKELSQSSDPVARETSIYAIRKLGKGKEIKKAIKKLQNDPNPVVSKYANFVMESL